MRAPIVATLGITEDGKIHSLMGTAAGCEMASHAYPDRSYGEVNLGGMAILPGGKSSWLKFPQARTTPPT